MIASACLGSKCDYVHGDGGWLPLFVFMLILVMVDEIIYSVLGACSSWCPAFCVDPTWMSLWWYWEWTYMVVVLRVDGCWSNCHQQGSECNLNSELPGSLWVNSGNGKKGGWRGVLAPGVRWVWEWTVNSLKNTKKVQFFWWKMLECVMFIKISDVRMCWNLARTSCTQASFNTQKIVLWIFLIFIMNLLFIRCKWARAPNWIFRTVSCTPM